MESYAITISPDPQRIVGGTFANKQTYAKLSPDKQYQLIKRRVQCAIRTTVHRVEVAKDIQPKIKLIMYSEFNDSFMIHTHGILKISSDYVKLFRDEVFNELGRELAKGNLNIVKDACCKIDLLSKVNQFRKDEEMEHSTWEEYIMKDQNDRHLSRFPAMILEAKYHKMEDIDTSKLDVIMKEAILDKWLKE